MNAYVPPDAQPDAAGRVVFDWLSHELEAAKCNLAAQLIHQDRFADVPRHRYAFSLPVAVAPPHTAFVHYFLGPSTGDDDGALPRPLVPVRTVHTPGVDDLGGLIRLSP